MQNLKNLKLSDLTNKLGAKEYDDLHLYYNVQLRNNSYSVAMPATFEETREQPLLDNPEDWKMAVIRFKVPIEGVPLFFFEMDDEGPPTPPYDSIYLVTLTWNQNNTTYDARLRADTKFGIGSDPAATESFLTVWDVQPFINSLNDAISRAFADLKTANPTFPGQYPPWFKYESANNLISVFFEQGAWYPDNVNGGSMYFNTVLWTLFQSLPATEFITPASPEDSPWTAIVRNNGNNFYQVSATNPDPNGNYGYSAWEMKQEITDLGNWSHFETLVVTSNMLPIVKETNAASNGSGQVIYTQTITDFEPVKSAQSIDASPLQFQAQGPWRWVDLKGNIPLNKVDVNLFWQDRDGTLAQMFVPPRDAFSVKIAFARKDKQPINAGKKTGQEF
jgi:hypothetical protein